MPFLRVTRDQRGYETTFLLHAAHAGGRPRVLYWYRTAPGIVLGISAVLALALVVFSFLSDKRDPPTGANYGLVVAVFAIFFAYVGALPYLGFRIATFLFVPALQVTLEFPRSRKAWAVVAATALVTTVVSYVLFERYLQVLLPRGRWTDF